MSNKYGTLLGKGGESIFPICQTIKTLPEGSPLVASYCSTDLSYKGSGAQWTAGTWSQKGPMCRTDAFFYTHRIDVPDGETWAVKMTAICGSVYSYAANDWLCIGLCEVNTSETVLKDFGTALYCSNKNWEWGSLIFDTVQEFTAGRHFIRAFVLTANNNNDKYAYGPSVTSAPDARYNSSHEMGPAVTVTSQIVERIVNK